MYITINKIGGLLDDKFRIAYRLLEHCKSIDDIQHPSVRETLRFLEIDESLDINIFSDLPARTGLGSSSSFTVGLLNSLYVYKNIAKSPMELADTAIHIEKDLLKENVGVQDQLAAAYGGFNTMKLSRDSYEISPLDIGLERKKELESSLFLYYTGVSRFATDVLEEQMVRIKEKKNHKELKDIYTMVEGAVQILQNSSLPLSEFGMLLGETWELKKKLSSSITTAGLDEMYTYAIRSGATGGKLLGAGGGGFFLFYVEEEKRNFFKFCDFSRDETTPIF